MKAQLVKVPIVPFHSFSVRQDFTPEINSKWHFHLVAELILFHQGSGIQYTGDNIRTFSAGSVVLIGPGLPHCWQYDQLPADMDHSPQPFSTSVHFDTNLFGTRFLQLPEAGVLASLLEKAGKGVFLAGDKEPEILCTMKRIQEMEGMDRILALLKCLVQLSTSPHTTVLSSSPYTSGDFTAGEEKINSVFEFSRKHLKQKIYLREVAALAGMSANAFCRYFKARTGKTYVEYLTELRVGLACKLLIENRMTKKQICFESGFNSLTYFYRNFLALKGESPSHYQKRYLKLVRKPGEE